ncbi:MAG TPA: hypothetical protein VIR58_11230, partial [Acidimicrobiales bacterium]
MDGSDNAATALRWGVEEAEVREATAEAVLVWSYLDQHHVDPSAPFDPQYGAEKATATLASWVGSVLGADHGVALRAVCDLPARGV